MVAVKEGVLAHEAASDTAATVGKPLFPTTGVITYRVVLQSAAGFMAEVDVDAASGDEAAAEAHAKQPGCKVLHISPAPPKSAKAA